MDNDSIKDMDTETFDADEQVVVEHRKPPYRCMGCKAGFVSETAFDHHRIGEHGVRMGENRRRCMTTDEMENSGMELTARGWRFKMSEKERARLAALKDREPGENMPFVA